MSECILVYKISVYKYLVWEVTIVILFCFYRQLSSNIQCLTDKLEKKILIIPLIASFYFFCFFIEAYHSYELWFFMNWKISTIL